jgi:hypothetical protein
LNYKSQHFSLIYVPDNIRENISIPKIEDTLCINCYAINAKIEGKLERVDREVISCHYCQKILAQLLLSKNTSTAQTFRNIPPQAFG